MEHLEIRWIKGLAQLSGWRRCSRSVSRRETAGYLSQFRRALRPGSKYPSERRPFGRAPVLETCNGPYLIPTQVEFAATQSFRLCDDLTQAFARLVWQF